MRTKFYIKAFIIVVIYLAFVLPLDLFPLTFGLIRPVAISALGLILLFDLLTKSIIKTSRLCLSISILLSLLMVWLSYFNIFSTYNSYLFYGVITLIIDLDFVSSNLVFSSEKKLLTPIASIILGIMIIAVIMTNNTHYFFIDKNDTYGFFFPIYLLTTTIVLVSSFILLVIRSSLNKKQFLIFPGIFILGLVIQQGIFIVSIENDFFAIFYLSYILASFAIGLIPMSDSSALAIDKTLLQDIMNDSYKKKEDLLSKLQSSIKELDEESLIITAENDLKAEKERFELKATIYSRIENHTASELKKIKSIISRNEDICHLAFYGAYIKRISNLMLLESINPSCSIGELFLSIKESLYYLPVSTNLKAEDISLTMDEDKLNTISSTLDDIITKYTLFEELLEKTMDELTHVDVSLSYDDEIRLKVQLEGKEEMIFDGFL